MWIINRDNGTDLNLYQFVYDLKFCDFNFVICDKYFQFQISFIYWVILFSISLFLTVIASFCF